MGDTLRYARRIRLAETEPRGDVSSTGYALVNPGEEYLVLQPREGGETFTVALEAGTYAVEWFSVNARETNSAGTVTVERAGSVGFTTPFAQAGAAVLHLWNAAVG
jgi:hypothetical protein